MDRDTFTGLGEDFRRQCGTKAALPDLAVELVHGIGGNARHRTDPLSQNPADTWSFALQTRPQGGQGIGSSPPYQAGSVAPWTELLGDAEMAWISWSQGRSDDLLQYATVGVGTAPLRSAMVPWADPP